MNNEESGGGLHIDSDWKTEAAREKEILAAEEKKAAKEGDTEGTGQPAFADLINVLAMQAAISLGGFRGPGGETIPPNPQAAKHQIDLLDVLSVKTKGNLSDEEKRTLDGVLYELRMQFVTLAGASTAPSPPETPSDTSVT